MRLVVVTEVFVIVTVVAVVLVAVVLVAVVLVDVVLVAVVLVDAVLVAVVLVDAEPADVELELVELRTSSGGSTHKKITVEPRATDVPAGGTVATVPSLVPVPLIRQGFVAASNRRHSVPPHASLKTPSMISWICGSSKGAPDTNWDGTFSGDVRTPGAGVAVAVGGGGVGGGGVGGGGVGSGGVGGGIPPVTELRG